MKLCFQDGIETRPINSPHSCVNSLDRRDPNACLVKLRIKGVFDGSTFNHWLINYALDKHVKEIYLFDDSYVDTSLPQRMFCANSIQVLELKVEVPDLILSCPLIEDFRVTHCSGLKSIRVSRAKKLKVVKHQERYQMIQFI